MVCRHRRQRREIRRRGGHWSENETKQTNYWNSDKIIIFKHFAVNKRRQGIDQFGRDLTKINYNCKLQAQDLNEQERLSNIQFFTSKIGHNFFINELCSSTHTNF